MSKQRVPEALSDMTESAKRAAVSIVNANDAVSTALSRRSTPHATLSRTAVEQAITAGHWEHENPSIALWLNSAFPPTGRAADELTADLIAHGIVVQ